MGRVEGKVAFITGAGRGQGRSHAVRLAQEGADIIAVDICEDIAGVGRLAGPMATEEDLATTAGLVEELDRRVVAIKADVRDAEALSEAVRRGVAELGRLDIVVANAAICTIQRWDDVSPEIWTDTIGVNLTGVWNTCVAAGPYLVSAGGGSMILTSSVAGLKGQPFLAPYVASKHGVVGIMHALAQELAPHDVRVNTVHPTGVMTPMYEALFPHLPGLFEDSPWAEPLYANLLQTETTMLEPIDISHAVLFLASDESRGVTGSTFTVDLGNTAR